MREDGFSMLVPEFENCEDIIEEFSDLDTIMIYSTWRGYVDKDIGKGAYNEMLADICKRHSAIDMHTGGHAYPEFIDATIREVNLGKSYTDLHIECGAFKRFCE